MREGFVTIHMPIQGEILPLEGCQDEAIAAGLLGRGILIAPSSNLVYAPCDGKIVLVYPNKHAIVIKETSGIAVLIHIGTNIETLDCDIFTIYVKDGDEVKMGDLIMKIQEDAMKVTPSNFISPLLFPNLNDNDFLSVSIKCEVLSCEPVIGIKKMTW